MLTRYQGARFAFLHLFLEYRKNHCEHTCVSVVNWFIGFQELISLAGLSEQCNFVEVNLHPYH